MTATSTNLALFDFDGTISRKDSFLLFIRYVTRFAQFWSGCVRLSPRIAAFLAGSYPNHNLKEDFLHMFLAGMSRPEVEVKAKQFSQEVLPAILRKKAMESVRQHQEQGDRVIVVSATPEPVLRPWCARNNLELIATRLEVVDGFLTGRIKGANCRGREKVRRVKKLLDPRDYAAIFAYGDTEGDLPLLEFADIARYKPFRD